MVSHFSLKLRDSACSWMKLQRSPKQQYPFLMKAWHPFVLYDRLCSMLILKSCGPWANWHLLPQGQKPLSMKFLQRELLAFEDPERQGDAMGEKERQSWWYSTYSPSVEVSDLTSKEGEWGKSKAGRDWYILKSIMQLMIIVHLIHLVHNALFPQVAFNQIHQQHAFPSRLYFALPGIMRQLSPHLSGYADYIVIMIKFIKNLRMRSIQLLKNGTYLANIKLENIYLAIIISKQQYHPLLSSVSS